uniref:Dephospho-CoA kinase n=1 Tax=candidate division WOR-3 bacterium TaxID=2052148 RepID=A0A7C4CCP2_UNCW3
MFDRKLSQERLLVGIGGNIGSGKSTIANELRRYGAKVIDADQLGWGLLHRNTAEYRKLVATFGRTILNKGGQVDRRALGRAAFASRTSLKKLNAIMHPPLIERVREEIARNKKGLVVVDAALLFQWGLHTEMDVSILVTAPDRLKIKRMVESGLTEEEARQRLALQEPDSKVWRKADFVLENKGSFAELRRKSRALWNFFYSARFQNIKQARSAK